MSASPALTPVPFVHATLSVFRIALKGMRRTQRSLWLLVVLGLPVLIALVQRLSGRGRAADVDLYGQLVSGYYLGYIAPGLGMAVPLIALLYAAAIVSDEVEGRTLVYFLSRPIPRATIVLGKFAAYLAWTLAATFVSMGLVFLLSRGPGAAGSWHDAVTLPRDLAAAALALAAYGAVFALAGVWLRRPLLPGIVFLYVWELAARLAGFFSRLTLGAQVEAVLARKTVPSSLAWLASTTTIPAAQAALVLGVVTLAGLALASVFFSQREYVPDQ
jgi:ABC-type transport system involved in multi-copper enzyme maturation permease subunit